MLVVLPFCSKDKPLAIGLAHWIKQLGGVKSHECMLVFPPSTDTSTLLDPLREAFGKVFILKTPDDRDGWPQGPNLLFRRAARQIEATSPQPWLWLEPDAIPVGPHWLDTIEAQYRTCDPKRPFMGSKVELPGILAHMSGVAVYPGNAPTLAPLLVTCNAVAFDVNGQSEVLPRLTPTDLIQHEWKPATFATAQDLDRIRPRTLIYHQVKDGSLIARLREKRTPSVLEVEPRAGRGASTGQLPTGDGERQAEGEDEGEGSETSPAQDLSPEQLIEHHVGQLKNLAGAGHSRAVSMYLTAAGLLAPTPPVTKSKPKPTKKAAAAI